MSKEEETRQHRNAAFKAELKALLEKYEAYLVAYDWYGESCIDVNFGETDSTILTDDGMLSPEDL